MEYGWIGGGPPADVPSVVVSAAHSALGAVHRFGVQVGTRTLLLHPDAGGRAGERRPADGLDVGAYLAERLDLADRDGPAAERWSGTLPLSRYAALPRADPGDGAAPAWSDISVRDAATLRWLRANAGRYGFVNDVPSEAWALDLAPVATGRRTCRRR